MLETSGMYTATIFKLSEIKNGPRLAKKAVVKQGDIENILIYKKSKLFSAFSSFVVLYLVSGYHRATESYWVGKPRV